MIVALLRMEIRLMTTEDHQKSKRNFLAQPETLKSRDPLSLHDSARDQLDELQTENVRLQRLVAELLLKNQRLRKPGGIGEP